MSRRRRLSLIILAGAASFALAGWVRGTVGAHRSEPMTRSAIARSDANFLLANAKLPHGATPTAVLVAKASGIAAFTSSDFDGQ